MIIYPAIDLLGGQCVRLVKGEYDTASRVAVDALETARSFRDCGATHLHMVDLDGAKAGRGHAVNRSIISKIVSETGLSVDLGGGIRTLQDIEETLKTGVAEAVLGSAATDLAFLSEAVSRFGDRICVGIDAKNGYVATSGWTDVTGLDYLEFAAAVEKTGVKRIIFTDISRDGTLQGPNLDMLKKLKEKTGLSVTASGGIKTEEDLESLDRIGIDGVICGKSLYARTLDLASAVARFERKA